MVIAVCIRVFIKLFAGSNTSIILAISTSLIANLGLGVLGSSFSLIVNLTVDFFFDATGILRVGCTALFFGLPLVTIPIGLRVCHISSSASIWSLHRSLLFVNVDGMSKVAGLFN
jgi:hypothetical protein